VQTEGTTQVSNVTTAGTTQVAAVNTAGTTQVAAVNAAGSGYAALTGATFTGNVDFGSNKITYSNVYAQLSDLPSAATYHGMFAHVHATGKGYYAHGGAWIPLVNEDGSGNVTIGGNLTVSGTTTTVNSTTLDVADLNITVAKNASDAAAANGAGLTVAGASATFNYANTGDKWTMNKPLSVTGAVTATSFAGDGSALTGIGGTGNVSFTGTTLSTSSNADLTLDPNGSGGVVIDSRLGIQAVKEKLSIDTTTSGLISFDIMDGAVKYFTVNQTGNRAVNFRGNSSTTLDSILAVGESVTVAMVMKQGSTAYYINETHIDGAGPISGVYVGGAPSGGNASGSDVYTFTIFKLASNHLVIHGSVVQYKS
jgi:hypothetical protein